VTNDNHLAAEHQVQLDLLRALQDILARGGEDRSASTGLLKQLLDYSEAHFLSEQLLMRLYAYPAYEEHVQEHERLIGDLRDLSVAWTEGETEAAGNLLARVEDWLLTHMSTTDKVLESYLAEHGPRPS
jgi:hemerythrin-like metal-binding protein